MKIYRVGGAVRDKLLGLQPTEHDWVVVGSTPEEMLRHGYKRVGKHFPVFLHPETHEEYALARTERKTGPGYTGFDAYSSPDVTLEEDLKRRDLTINAIAEDNDGNIIDPYNGVDDIKQRQLRHVSAAFTEDPVRVLRVARFSAKLADFTFSIAPETNALMQSMVTSGEVDTLVPERVWKELERSLSTNSPHSFFETLRGCGALKKLFPEIEQLFGVPQTEKHHPEIDTGIHTLMVLQQATALSTSTTVRFAALVHDLGKGTTPKALWPKHIDHEKRGIPLINAFCHRLRIPNNYRDLALHVSRYHLHCHRAAELTPSTMLKVLKNIDALRRPERFEEFLLACEADARGRKGFETSKYPQAALFRTAFDAVARLDIRAITTTGQHGSVIAQKLHELRIHAITQAVAQFTPDG